MLTAEQQAIRRTGIGSSEIGAVVGVSRYSPIEVWRSKVEPDYVREDNPNFRRGRILEPAVAAWYAEETGAELSEPGTIVHRKNKLVIATPDRIAHLAGQKRVLELKTAFHSGDWGEAGTDEVPMAYLTQVAWEMAAANIDVADLAVLIGGHDFRIYHLSRDEDLERTLIEQAEEWWERHVVGGVAPEPDASDEYSRWLTDRYPRQMTPLLQATPAVEQLVAELKDADLELKRAALHASEVKNAMKALIGEAEGVQSTLGKITWRSNKESTRVDWEDVALELAAGSIPAEILSKHSQTKPGARVLRFPWSRE